MNDTDGDEDICFFVVKGTTKRYRKTRISICPVPRFLVICFQGYISKE